MRLRWVLFLLALVLLLGSSLVTFAYQDDRVGPVLCDPDDPVVTPFTEMETVDDYTYVYRNETGQEFRLSLNSDVDSDTFQEFIDNTRVCFELAPALPIQFREYGDYYLYVTEQDDVQISLDAPFPEMVLSAAADVTGMPRSDITGMIEGGTTLQEVLDSAGVNPSDVFDVAAASTLFDPDLVNQLIAEMGYPDGAYGILLEQYQVQFDTMLEQSEALVLGNNAPGGIQIEIDLVGGDDEITPDTDGFYFFIDPPIKAGPYYRHEWIPNFGSLLSASVSSTGGKVDNYLLNSRGQIVWGPRRAPPNPASSGATRGARLRVVGVDANNSYTVAGTAWRQVCGRGSPGLPPC